MSFFYNESSGASGLLDLLERKCPYLMRVGGGPIANGCDDDRPWRVTTNEQKQKAIELAETGKYSATHIAKIVGTSQSTMRCFLKLKGYDLPDGRALRKAARLASECDNI